VWAIFQEIKSMKKSISRFALMAILGSILSSALMVGCGSGGGGDETVPSNSSSNAVGNSSSNKATK
jgi:hypothetical protein